MVQLKYQRAKRLKFSFLRFKTLKIGRFCSSIPFGFTPQPETGSETTLRPYREKEEVTTTCAKPNEKRK